MSHTLPELPEPTSLWDRPEYPHYTPDQLRSYGNAVWEAAIEEAARVCDDLALTYHDEDGTYPAGKKTGAFTCASAIRSLKALEGGK